MGSCSIRRRRLFVAPSQRWVTILLYVIVPKGFFPVQDTGVIQGISEAAKIFLSPRWPNGSRRSRR
jgi:multidrug efflux pump subunit AcrB